MALAGFLTQLQEHGRVRVAPLEGEAPLESEDVAEVLRELDRLARLELPGEAPGLSMRSAVWAAQTLYRASQLLVFRDADAAEVARRLGSPCPEPPSPPVLYSVDLTFRYLPDLYRLAREAAPSDPLVEAILRLARDWPLSSVGISAVGETPADDAVLADPTLRRLYVDRILETEDVSRLGDPRVREVVREALGIHGSLRPRVSAALSLREEKAGDP